MMFSTMINAQGKACRRTVDKNWPLMRSRLGSKVRKKEGIPSTTMLMRLSCIGIKG